MFAPDQYGLLDFGHAMKTERFSGVVVKRETPSAGLIDPARANPPLRSGKPFRSQPADFRPNNEPDLTYLRSPGKQETGNWIESSGFSPPVPWLIRHRQKCFQLKPTPSGQVGLFPEQAENWEWIESKCKGLSGLKGLNLFAYTGGTTLSLASLGASVAHVDSAASVVKWARKNAELSDLQQAPIRWIVEDALRYIGREAKRQTVYDILIADPPSYGKGPKGESWRLIDHLPTLLDGLSRIASPRLSLLIISCHTMGYDEQVLLDLVQRRFDLSHGKTEALCLNLTSLDGRLLPSGHCVRFVSNDLRR